MGTLAQLRFQGKALPKRAPPALPLYYSDLAFPSDLEYLKSFCLFPYGDTTTDGYGYEENWTLEGGALKHTMPPTAHAALIFPAGVRNVRLRLRWNLGVLESIEEIGVIARWDGQENRYYLRYTYYPEAYRVRYELRKHVNGTVVALGNYNFTAEPNTWYTMELTVVGNRLVCKHEGRVIMEAEDADLTSGYFGLHSAASEGVSHLYDEVEVVKL